MAIKTVKSKVYSQHHLLLSMVVIIFSLQQQSFANTIATTLTDHSPPTSKPSNALTSASPASSSSSSASAAAASNHKTTEHTVIKATIEPPPKAKSGGSSDKLIDDIVKQLQTEQVNEIASELAKEQHKIKPNSTAASTSKAHQTTPIGKQSATEHPSTSSTLSITASSPVTSSLAKGEKIVIEKISSPVVVKTTTTNKPTTVIIIDSGPEPKKQSTTPASSSLKVIESGSSIANSILSEIQSSLDKSNKNESKVTINEKKIDNKAVVATNKTKKESVVTVQASNQQPSVINIQIGSTDSKTGPTTIKPLIVVSTTLKPAQFTIALKTTEAPKLTTLLLDSVTKHEQQFGLTTVKPIIAIIEPVHELNNVTPSIKTLSATQSQQSSTSTSSFTSNAASSSSSSSFQQQQMLNQPQSAPSTLAATASTFNANNVQQPVFNQPIQQQPLQDVNQLNQQQQFNQINQQQEIFHTTPIQQQATSSAVSSASASSTLNPIAPIPPPPPPQNQGFENQFQNQAVSSVATNVQQQQVQQSNQLNSFASASSSITNNVPTDNFGMNNHQTLNSGTVASAASSFAAQQPQPAIISAETAFANQPIAPSPQQQPLFNPVPSVASAAAASSFGTINAQQPVQQPILTNQQTGATEFSSASASSFADQGNQLAPNSSPTASAVVTASAPVPPVNNVPLVVPALETISGPATGTTMAGASATGVTSSGVSASSSSTMNTQASASASAISFDSMSNGFAQSSSASSAGAAAANSRPNLNDQSANGAKIIDSTVIKSVDKALDLISGPSGLFGASTASAVTTPSPILKTLTSPLDKMFDSLRASGNQEINLNVKTNLKATTTNKPKLVVPTKESEHDELMRLRTLHGASNVHDVIVVGEHVDGDDKSFDYEDHSGHHEDHESDMIRLEHESPQRRPSSATVIKTELKKTKPVGAHEDHLHLLKGLKAGDVIHVDAGELERASSH